MGLASPVGAGWLCLTAAFALGWGWFRGTAREIWLQFFFLWGMAL